MAAWAAIAPLFFTENRDGQPALLLLGSVEISDYLDVIICPAGRLAFVEALFDHLAAPQAPPWQVLDFYNLLETSPTLAVLQTAAARARLDHHPGAAAALPLHPAARRLGDLPGRAVDKKQRHEIRRKMRRAESYEQNRALVYRRQTPLDLESGDRGLPDLMAQDPIRKPSSPPPCAPDAPLPAPLSTAAGCSLPSWRWMVRRPPLT